MLQNHLQRVGENKCAFVRAMVFANAAMASRSNLEREMHSWIEKEGVVPPGNGPEQELWEVLCSLVSYMQDSTLFSKASLTSLKGHCQNSKS